MRVFITGGTGLIGTRLVKRLRERQDEAVVLSRRAAKMDGAEVVQGDPTQPGPWQDTAAACDAIINLAGEGILSKRWSPEFKKVLLDSRVKSTANCVDCITRIPKRADGSPKVMVSASAIGYYGPRGDEVIDEANPPGNDYQAHICTNWEKAAHPAEAGGVRLALARIGIVLAPEGGPLAKMLTPFKLCLGGPMGSGKQYMSWVHIDDAVGLLLFALDTSAATGPMNVTAPNPVTNKQFGKALGKAIGRPAIFWTPGFLIRLGFGEGAVIIVTGQNVHPRAALHWGYTFKFPDLDVALADIFKK